MKSPSLPLARLTSPRPYICTSCRSRPSLFKPQSHPFSTSKPHASSIPPPPPSAYAPLPSRRIISLTGPDSTRYLQGVITNTVTPPTGPWKEGFYAAFLNAKGRLLNDVFVYPQGEEGWLIEADAREVDRLAKMMKRFRLGSKYEVRVLDVEEVGVFSLWGSSSYNGGGKGAIASCEDVRAPGMGRRLLLQGGQKPELDAEHASEDTYTLRRYLHGVPEGQDELLRETALPQESNIDYMNGISYKKGCYVGQELTVRTHHRGVVRKRILPVQLYGLDDPAPKILEYNPEKEFRVENIPEGTTIKPFEKRGKSAGKFIKGIGNVGLALCRLKIMTPMTLGEEGDTEGYKDSDEFTLEWGLDEELEVEDGKKDMVKIKAFVPEWHLSPQKI